MVLGSGQWPSVYLAGVFSSPSLWPSVLSLSHPQGSQKGRGARNSVAIQIDPVTLDSEYDGPCLDVGVFLTLLRAGPSPLEFVPPDVMTLSYSALQSWSRGDALNEGGRRLLDPFVSTQW